jgi:branched-chain amino acid transport system substrate-binding protein
MKPSCNLAGRLGLHSKQSDEKAEMRTSAGSPESSAPNIRMEQTRKRKIAPWVLGLLLLACVSCPRSDPRALKIGLIVDLTGWMAPYGTSARNGLDIALSEINSKANQSASLHVLRRDAQSDPRRALAAAEELIDGGVQALIVATSSYTVLRMAPLCQRRQVVLFSPTVSSADISSAGQFIFRNRISSAVESAAMGFYAAGMLGFRAVGLAVIDNEAGALYETGFRQAFETGGGRIVRSVRLKPGQTDCQAQAAELKGAPGLEAVFLAYTGSTAHESAWLIRHAADMGFRPQWLGVMTMSGFEQREGFAQAQNIDAVRIAGNLLEGLLYASETFDPAATPAAQAFARQYQERFGEPPSNYAANGYDAARVLFRILQAGSRSGPAIRDELFRGEYSGLTGPFSFDHNGDVRKPVLIKIKQFTGGKFRVVVPLLDYTAQVAALP